MSGTWTVGRTPVASPGLLLYILVDDVAATLEAVTANGGQIVQPVGLDAPEITARISDPAGNIVGVFEEPNRSFPTPFSNQEKRISLNAQHGSNGMISKGYKGLGMEGFIARSYDKNAQKYSLTMYQRWADQLAPQIREGSNVLEIAPGPGYLAIEIAKRKKCKLFALEISETFVELARTNAQHAGVEIDIRRGNASDMPFERGMFDFILCSSSFKNFSEPVRALQEIHRVLKAGGKAWISDLRRDVSDKTIRDFVANEMKVKGLAAAFMRYAFKHTLRPRAYSAEQFKEMASMIPIRKIEVRNNPMDFEALLEK